MLKKSAPRQKKIFFLSFFIWPGRKFNWQKAYEENQLGSFFFPFVIFFKK